MIPYLLLLAAALLSAGLIYYLIRINRLPLITLWIVLLATSTAFLAMLVAQTMSICYALLVIIGLSFATAVLLAKRQESH
ncbi:hypothetical protein [Sporosarcina trichiuri]|uniref:hypothetical protein n=1 Tax=Sporosarcina trichiuri TaxID=3056445 RepID=UPI0025B5CE5E|nr:hypothetical protein [Sporosarcina sp. 0.2-SM1T-5]WJY28168.1 hypothetical protein QWT68_04070 [Sporosarcina sp. 0.2-SM1T-5]